MTLTISVQTLSAVLARTGIALVFVCITELAVPAVCTFAHKRVCIEFTPAAILTRNCVTHRGDLLTQCSCKALEKNRKYAAMKNI